MTKKIKSTQTDFEAELKFRIGYIDDIRIQELYNEFLDDKLVYDCVAWIEGNKKYILENFDE